MKVLKPLQNRRVTLHVGLPKTATSALQSTLADNYAQCMDTGLCYPQAMRTPARYRRHKPLQHAARTLTESDFVSAYQSVLTEAGDRDIVFSSEDIHSQLARRKDPLVTYLNRIHGAENVHILISLRNVYDFADSVIAQFYKATLFGIEPHELALAGNLTPQGILDAAEDAYGFPVYSFMSYVNAIKAHCPENEIRLVSIEKNDLNEPYLDFMARYLGLEGEFANPPRKNVNARKGNQLQMCFREARHYLRQSEFKEYQRRIVAYSAKHSIQELEARNRYLHIDDALRAKISHVAEAEKEQLLPFMYTPCAALFENKPVPPTEDVDLPRAMKEDIRRICTEPPKMRGFKRGLSSLRRKFQR
ncbi:hypothetical protein [uncultured Aliiroseovarius sp.]|uniref:hypothetical protein n=1 Tax=uncultured Aliiroseovarius sp. TaxID=1658783 RepID=UPI002626A166|nr:hypothetical protein [uncultured Aliiroseovarius sp.]